MQVGGSSGRLRCMRPLQDPCGANAIIMHHLRRPMPMIPTGSTSLMREMLRYASGIACSSSQAYCKVEGAVRQNF